MKNKSRLRVRVRDRVNFILNSPSLTRNMLQTLLEPKNLRRKCQINNRINLVWLSFNFFHLGEAWLSSVSWLDTLVCEVIQKYHEMSFIYNYLHFKYSFCSQPLSFSQLENVSKLLNNNHTVNVNKRNENKNKIKHVTFKLTNCYIFFSFKQFTIHSLRNYSFHTLLICFKLMLLQSTATIYI